MKPGRIIRTSPCPSSSPRASASRYGCHTLSCRHSVKHCCQKASLKPLLESWECSAPSPPWLHCQLCGAVPSYLVGLGHPFPSLQKNIYLGAVLQLPFPRLPGCWCCSLGFLGVSGLWMKGKGTDCACIPASQLTPPAIQPFSTYVQYMLLVVCYLPQAAPAFSLVFFFACSSPCLFPFETKGIQVCRGEFMSAFAEGEINQILGLLRLSIKNNSLKLTRSLGCLPLLPHLSCCLKLQHLLAGERQVCVSPGHSLCGIFSLCFCS